MWWGKVMCRVWGGGSSFLIVLTFFFVVLGGAKIPQKKKTYCGAGLGVCGLGPPFTPPILLLGGVGRGGGLWGGHYIKNIFLPSGSH